MSRTGPLTKMLNRRQILKATAAAGAACFLPTIIPAKALGKDGATAPSERITMAGIGIGGRGEFDLGWMLPEKDVQFVAICDLRKSRRLAIKRKIDQHNGNSDCQMYPEIREFLATRTDIDGALIATGDRWHSLAAVLAMRAGKDVYSEKPSSMTIREGRTVVETARRYGRIYQTGVQRLSEAHHVIALELARQGRLGEVKTVRAHIAPWDAAEMSHAWLPAEPQPSKEVCDWDAWLGPCPWRPYNSTYVSGGWRNHYDFHTSCIGEWGAHTFAQSQAGIDASFTSAIEYHYVPNDSGDGMHVKFGNGVTMILERDRAGKIWHGSCGMKFEGTEGWASAADSYTEPDLSSPSLLVEGKKLLNEYIERTGRPMSHVRNFFDCIKSRQQTVANPDVMHRSMSTVHAANVCMWLKRDVKYDPVKEEFVNDPEANRYLVRAQREPWIY
jgi:hypothetical protein